MRLSILFIDHEDWIDYLIDDASADIVLKNLDAGGWWGFVNRDTELTEYINLDYAIRVKMNDITQHEDE